MKEQDLREELRQLKQQVTELSWTKDYIEIWQLMSRYAHLYHVFRRNDIVDLFAKETPGVLVEIEDSGIYEGGDAPKRFFGSIISENRHKVPGFLGVHMTLNPLLEFNKARTKAKGVWFSHGSVTLVRNGQPISYWCLGKYDMEYVKERGQWKILKLVYRMAYMSPCDKNWIEESQGASITSAALNAQCPPDKPTTFHMPYSPYRVNIFQPPPPEPYND